MIIPKIDRDIGIEVYSTDFEGIKGKIKFDHDSFIVEEVIGNVKLSDHGYALYRLEKKGIDTQHAIDDIYRKHKLRLKFFGMKDANAKTIQYAIATKKGYYKEINESQYSLKFIGFTEPLTRDILLANRFTIMIKDHEQKSLDILEDLDMHEIANFYGYQRFGSRRPITHLIGREIVKRNFKNAVELLIENNSIDFEYDVKMEYEKSRDAIKALRKVPIRIRRLFVEAYQSYLFNRLLSMIIKEGYDLKARDGDLSFVFADRVELREFSDKYRSILALPIIGYGFRGKGRFLELIDRIMREEAINHKDFYVKEMQEVSSRSNFRQASLYYKDFTYSLDPLILRFTLQKGGYATILLREIMKPEDPIASGF